MKQIFYRSLLFVAVLFVGVSFHPLKARGNDAVVVTSGVTNTGFENSKQIVRTSTNRLYYFNGNGSSSNSLEGQVEAQTSIDGSIWSRVSSAEQWQASSTIGVAIDSKNIIHVITYDWTLRPQYRKFNTIDSEKGDNSWEGSENLDIRNDAGVGKAKCAITIDSSGVPHVVYSVTESYKGKVYSTVTYANRVGGTWNKVYVWPKELKTNFSGTLEIAMGPSDIPYILAGEKMMRGNSNSPSSFETVTLAGSYSFALNSDGCVAVAASRDAKYGRYSYCANQPWNSAWNFLATDTLDSPGIILVEENNIYKIFTLNGQLWLQKESGTPLLLASPSNGAKYDSVTIGWSSFNYKQTRTIDIGTRSWDASLGNILYYYRYELPTTAFFSSDKRSGMAPLTVNFTEASKPKTGTTILTRAWDLDGDGASDSSEINPVYTYTEGGSYTVSLTVNDSSGGSDTNICQGCISVDRDTDSDGIPDSNDICPNAYNPLQIDLNKNGIGDTCEPPINRLSSASFMTRLKSMTAAEKNVQDITSLMTDELLSQAVALSSTDNSMISLKINKDARDIFKVSLRFYLSNIVGNPANTYVYIMPYNRDMITTIDYGMKGRAYNGWNEVDLTPIVHRMDGFGITKFRLAVSGYPNGFSIYEVSMNEKVDNKDIAVIPDTPDFGAVSIPSQSVQDLAVKNTGAEPLHIIKVHPPSSPYSIISDNCTGITLAPYDACSVSVSFKPVTDGNFYDVLVIDSDDADHSSLAITLKGLAQLALTGVVTDASTGRPINNARIEVIDSVKALTTSTDVNGAYTIRGVASGDFALNLSRADYVTQTINSTIDPSKINKLDAQLIVNYASITGTVSDLATGAPLPGVKMSMVLSGITSKDPADSVVLCNNIPLTAAELHVITENDENKFRCSEGYNTNPTMLFKMRNPCGMSPFTIRWNGIGANHNVEYLAQQFKPTKTGRLTKVSFYSQDTALSFESGGLHVLLKSKLGGDRGTYLAMSNKIPFSAVKNTWVDFDFPDPPMVVAGQEYFIEINGTFFELSSVGRSIIYLSWSNSDSYVSGRGYKREGGLWAELQGSLAFRNYIDYMQDVIAVPSSMATSMIGGNDARVSAPSYLMLDTQHPDSDGADDNYNRTKFNGDDLTGEAFVTDNLETYYNSDGWLSFQIMSYSFWSSRLITDQFNFSFSNTFTTQTNQNGAYALPSLLEGNYSATFEKSGYLPQVISGTFNFGSKQTVDVQLIPAPQQHLSITSPSDRTLTNLSKITVAGNTNNNAVVAINGLTVPVVNDSFSANVSLAEGSNTITVTATDKYGQVTSKAITVTFNSVPRISVAPIYQDFGKLQINETRNQSIVVKNVGIVDIELGAVARPAAPFYVIADGCSGKALPPSGSCAVMVQFMSVIEGVFSTELPVPLDEAGQLHLAVQLKGEVPAYAAYILPDTGQSGETQRNPLRYSVSGSSTVIDENTGLMWEREGSATAKNWTDAATYCQNLSKDGFTGWRLPSFLELTTIVHYGTSNPAIDKVLFPKTVTQAYWTSTAETIYANGKYLDAARTINFAYGEAQPLDKTGAAFIRCVRGQGLTSFFDVIGDPNNPSTQATFIDRNSGLVWMANEIYTPGKTICQSGTCRPATWNDLQLICALRSGWAGYPDWRAPTIKELASYNPDSYNWSTTSSQKPDAQGVLSQVWTYASGKIFPVLKTEDIGTNTLRCVRGGNTAPKDPMRIAVTPPVADFGYQEIGKPAIVVITVANQGTGDLQLGSIQNVPPPFSIISDTCSGQSLGAAASCSMGIEFSSQTPGTFSNSFTISSNDADKPSVTMNMIASASLPDTGLSGKVKDSSSGLPVAGATVTVTDGLNSSHTVLTDANGNYFFTNMATGSFNGTISKNGYSPFTFNGMLAPKEKFTINVSLVPILPVISSVAALNITANSATIQWTTDQQTTSLVEYGATTGYGSTAADATPMTVHVVNLTDLQPSATYHFRVSSTNEHDISSYSGDFSFTTPVFTVKTVGDNGNVAIMEITGNYDGNKADGSVNDNPRQEIAKEYFRTHPDTADFLVIFSNFDYSMPDPAAKGFYLGVRNDTQGIGQSLFDNSARFGSNGKLQGTVDMGNVTSLAANVYGPKLDETITILNHEIGHRWGAYVRLKNPDGSMNNSLLGESNTHWSYLLDTQGSIMYGNGWKDNKDGTFTSFAKQSVFSPLDLYLMGMIAKEQVPPMLLIDNPAIDRTQLPHLGDTITGTMKTISIDEIIAAEGARIPDAASSQKKFNVGFVMLTRPGAGAGSAPAAIETVRGAWAGRFAELTQGIGGINNVVPSLNLVIDSPTDNATVTGPDVTVTGTIINTTGVETGVTVSGIPATVSGGRFIVNHVPLQLGSNTITTSATDVNGLTASTTRAVTAQAGHYLRITTNIESGTPLLNLSLKLDGSFSIVNPTITISGPVPITLTPGANQNEMSARLDVEGTYTITASAQGPDSEIHTASVTITVLSRYQMDALLNYKWEGLKGRITAKDIEGAVRFLPTSSQIYYRELFAAMGDRLPLLAEDLPMPKLGSVKDSVAKSLMSRQETVLGQQETVGYLITFIKENGIWKLRQL